MSALCQCGCGLPAPIAPSSRARKGHIKGEPLPYRRGHANRKVRQLYLVDKTTGCWLWQGSMFSNGYGLYDDRDGTRMMAHRWVYERFRGPIPLGMKLDHVKERCSSRRCVNPDHVEPVTTAENNRRGGNTKLTIAEVVEIRRLRSEGVKSVDLATLYGVTQPTICNIVAHRIWKEL